MHIIFEWIGKGAVAIVVVAVVAIVISVVLALAAMGADDPNRR